MSRVSPNQGTQHVGSNLHSSGLVEFCFKPEPRTQVENQNVLKYRLEEMSLGLQHREVGFQESHTQPAGCGLIFARLALTTLYAAHTIGSAKDMRGQVLPNNQKRSWHSPETNTCFKGNGHLQDHYGAEETTQQVKRWLQKCESQSLEPQTPCEKLVVAVAHWQSQHRRQRKKTS